MGGAWVPPVLPTLPPLMKKKQTKEEKKLQKDETKVAKTQEKLSKEEEKENEDKEAAAASLVAAKFDVTTVNGLRRSAVGAKGLATARGLFCSVAAVAMLYRVGFSVIWRRAPLLSLNEVGVGEDDATHLLPMSST